MIYGLHELHRRLREQTVFILQVSLIYVNINLDVICVIRMLLNLQSYSLMIIIHLCSSLKIH